MCVEDRHRQTPATPLGAKMMGGRMTAFAVNVSVLTVQGNRTSKPAAVHNTFAAHVYLHCESIK